MYCTQPEFGGNVIITLNARLNTNDCDQLKEVCLRFIEQEQKAIDLTQAITLKNELGESTGCEFHFSSDLLSDEHIDFIIALFTSTLAPKGSKISILENANNDCKQAFFGTLEGLALYLNGTDLPNDVYQNYSATQAYNACEQLLTAQELGNVCSIWQGPTETALYMYGPSAAAMQQAIAGFIESNPLCQKSRQQIIA